MTSRMSRTVVVGVVLIRAHQATDNHTTPYRPPCEIRRLPLDCHCNSGVNRQYFRGINRKRSLALPALPVRDAVCTQCVF
jgi:hypothetical protein